MMAGKSPMPPFLTGRVGNKPIMRATSLFALAGLAACSSAPFQTGSGLPTDDPTVTYAPRAAFCYNGANTTREELTGMAMDSCPKGVTSVTPIRHDTVFNDCPVTTKSRIVFQCNVPPAKKEQ